MEVMKQLRQRQIGQIIERRPVRTQHELATALREQGFRVTQATVSRDIADLGLRKGLRDGLSVYVTPDGGGQGASPGAGTTGQPAQPGAADGAQERLRYLLSSLPLELRVAGELLIVRSLPGSAHAIAAALDRVGWPEVVGSIAGDDTLFVAFESRATRDAVLDRLRRFARD